MILKKKLNNMIVYIQGLISATLKAFYYKKGSLLLVSILPALAIEMVNLNTGFFGISLGFIILFIVLIIADFITGIIASRYNGSKIESSKITFTFFKIFMYILCFWILHQINNEIQLNKSKNNTSVLNFLYDYSENIIGFLRNFIFTLVSMREYISIGENLEKRYNKKIYVFSLFEKIFDIIELKFFKKLEDTKICNLKDEVSDNTLNKKDIN